MIPLPPKLDLAGRIPDALSVEDRATYDAYYAEKARRKDPSQSGVAMEALQCAKDLIAASRSPSEAFTVYGYSLRSAVKPAIREERRIVLEIREKATNEIVINPDVPLDPEEIRVLNGLDEFVKVIEK